MSRLTLALLLLAAACGPKQPYHCDAVVTGTGTDADGTYTCQVPPKGVFTPPSKAGSISGFALSPNGHLFSFILSTSSPPAETTYTDLTLASGDAYTVSILSRDSTPLWEADTGSGAFELTVTRLNTMSTQPPLTDAWPTLTGSLKATLSPRTNNPATTTATVSMSFF